MLDTTQLEAIYEEDMDTWLRSHDVFIPSDKCDLCEAPSSGVLYNVPGGNGEELLVCYNCYISLAKHSWRES